MFFEMLIDYLYSFSGSVRQFYYKILIKKGSKTMDQTVKNYIAEKVKDLMNSPSCCAEAKAAAEGWLTAVGTDKEAEQAKKLIAELEMDIMPVDGLIAFAESEAGEKVFGGETAKHIAAHGKEIKAAGAKYCDCPACAAAAAILEKKEELI